MNDSDDLQAPQGSTTSSVMANASSKRISAANTAALRSLARNIYLINALALGVRYVKSRVYGRAFMPSGFVLFLQIATFVATLGVWYWFTAIGSPRTDSKGNVKVGEDLAGGGIIELAWDMVYLTWICTLGSALLGSWFWYLFLLIPAFASWKIYGVIRPFLGMFLPGIFGPKGPKADAAAQDAQARPAESKKQAKLRARMERGDKRVQAAQQVRPR